MSKNETLRKGPVGVPDVAATQLHVFLGAGGVGKTTLSAGYALALARQGHSVGLMSIDPAKRLTTALGLADLSEKGTEVQDKVTQRAGGRLLASFLNVNASFQRWVEQEGLSDEARQKLFANQLFLALIEKFATATDTFAAVRVAEWAAEEKFDHIVVDTAPGLHAIDFLSKPDKLLAFLDGKLVDWLKWFVGADKEKKNMLHRVMKSGARAVLEGLAQIGGRSFLLNFGEFLILLDQVFVTMLKRLEFAVNWLRHPASSYYLITAVREDAVYVARRLVGEMNGLEISNRVSVINRGFPEILERDPGFRAALREHHLDQEQDCQNIQSPLLNYLASYTALQENVKNEMAATASQVINIPMASGLDGQDSIRVDDLVSLGQRICEAKQKGH